MIDVEYYWKFEELRNRKIKAFVHEINNKYMFVNSKEDTIYCSHCKKTMSRSDNKYYSLHNKECICPNCGSKVITKYTGFSRKNLDSVRNIVVFQKGKDNEIIGNGHVAVTNFLDYKRPSIKIFKKAIYVFKDDTAEMFTQNVYKFTKTSSVYNFDINSLQRFDLEIDLDSLKEASIGTKYEHIVDFICENREKYSSYDILPILDMYSRHPVIEQLLKCGLKQLIMGKKWGMKTYRTINFRATNIHKALRLTKGEYRYLTKIINPEEIDYTTLLYMQLVKKSTKDKNLLQVSHECILRGKYIDETRLEIIKDIIEYVNIDKMNDYLGGFNTNSLILYRDYISFLIKLNIPLDKANLYPKDLQKAHDKYQNRYKTSESKIKNKKIHEHLPILNKKYAYENDEFVIRPVETVKELINEGEKLKHCVATYSDRYVDGKTVIMVLRDKNSINKPLVTVEVNKQRMVQYRAKCNSRPDDKIVEFLREYASAKKITMEG